MINILIDPAVLAVPTYANDTESVVIIIDNLLEISEINSFRRGMLTVIDDDIEDILGTLYPNMKDITDYIDLHDLGHSFGARDVLRAYQSLIDRSSRSSSALGLKIEAVEGFTVEPPFPEDLSPAHLLKETEKTFCSVALKSESDEVWVIGSSFGGLTQSPYLVSAKAHIRTAGDMNSHCVKEIVDTRCTAISRLSQLSGEEIPSLLWSRSASSDDIYLSIALGSIAMRRAASMDASANQLSEFCIGSEFFESLRENQCSGAGKFSSTTFQLCCQLVAKITNRAVKPMGISTQTERAADSALAWRTHLTKSNEGFRLMHWTVGQMIEFANVGVKKEELIRDGDPRLATRLDHSTLYLLTN